jgi:hypothetical protein
MDKKVWYVTGASKGLGLSLIQQLLAAGHRVAAASKFLPELVDAVSKTPDAGFLPLEFDAANDAAIAGSIRTTRETFGPIDTVVINAGYQAANPLETNAVIRNMLPCFQTQGSGHIISIGLQQLPGQYTQYENIHLTTVVTSAFQPLPLPGAMTIPIDGKQIGDPRKAAAALLQIAALSKPPTRLLLTSTASNLATGQKAGLKEMIKQWEARLSLQPRSADHGQS